jgi:hypothetical protein
VNISLRERQPEPLLSWSASTRKTAALFYHRLRIIIAAQIEDESPV